MSCLIEHIRRLPAAKRAIFSARAARLFCGVALGAAQATAQPIGEPHVRWVTGGTVFPPTLIEFTPDGTSLFTHSASDVGLKKWGFASRELLSVTLVPARKTSLAGLSRDQQLVAFHTGALSLCRVVDGRVLWSAGLTTLSLFGARPEFSTDSSLLLAYGYGDPIRVWQVSDGSPVGTTFTMSNGTTNEFAWAMFVNAEEFIAVGPGEAIRFNARTGAAVWRQLDPAFKLFGFSALAPGASEFCAPTTNGLCRYSAATGEKIANVSEPPTNVTALAYSPDGATLAVALRNGAVELRSVTNGALQTVLTGLLDSDRELNVLAWSPDGKYLLGSGTSHSYLWQVSSAAPTEQFFPLMASLDPVRFSADGRWIVCGNQSGEVTLLNSTNGTVTHRWPRLDGNAYEITSDLCTFPTTNLVVVPTLNPVVHVRSIPDGALLFTNTLFTNGSVRNLEFSADGSRLMADNEGQIAVFATATWTRLREVSVYPDRVVHSRITPGGERMVAALSDGTTRVWSVSGSTSPLVISASGALEFGTTTDELWTLGKDGWMDVWQLSDGLRLGGFKIPATNYSAILSPDRRLILTSEFGEPLKLWRTDTGELAAELNGPLVEQFYGFTAAPDGRWLVATRRDSTLVAFDFPFVIVNFSLGVGQLHFRAAGTPGPFQLQARVPDAGVWTPVGAPFEVETSTELETEPARYFRLIRPTP